LATLAGVYIFNIRIHRSDLLFYRKLVQESLDLHGTSSLEKSPVKQKRGKVRKDIWRIKDGQRVHACIVSNSSDVTLREKKKEIEATEILSNVEAWVDSENEVRHFSAAKAIFHFPSCLVTANDLTADFGDIRCKGLEANWEKDTLQFFGAFQLITPKGILFSEKATLTRDGHFLTLSPQGKFEDKETVFSAEIGRAEFDPKKLLPQTFILEGNVKIASNMDEKESFAEADSATYHVDDKKLTLQSNPETQVFFRQGGLEINAPTVYVQDTIQGSGGINYEPAKSKKSRETLWRKTSRQRPFF
jgi:hypothetical protein